MSLVSKTKQLAIKLRANEDSYITGQLDLNETLDETERLYSEVQKKSGNDRISANEIMPDSDLMKLQTGLAKRSARFYKPDSLVFNPVEFSVKLKQYYENSMFNNSASQSTSQRSSRRRADDLLWFELGNVAKKLLNTVPSFNFIHGTFDPDPVEVVKKKRKYKEKDKVGDLTKPLSMKLSESSEKVDMTIKEAERVLGVLHKLLTKSAEQVVCFYEFVTDPTSFARTVENIFILSVLVKEGCVRVMKDEKGLPCLSIVDDNERKNRTHCGTKQCILSISVEEWKDIIETFNLKRPLIPPRKSANGLS